MVMREKVKDVAEACAEWLARRNGQRNGKTSRETWPYMGMLLNRFLRLWQQQQKPTSIFLFLFLFLFLIWIFSFSLWVFLLTWIRLVRFFIGSFVWLLDVCIPIGRKKEPKETPTKRPIVPMLSRASTLNWSTNKLVVDSFNFRTRWPEFHWTSVNSVAMRPATAASHRSFPAIPIPNNNNNINNNVINVRERTLAGRCFNQANVVGCRIKATPLYSAVN